MVDLEHELYNVELPRQELRDQGTLHHTLPHFHDLVSSTQAKIAEEISH